MLDQAVAGLVSHEEGWPPGAECRLGLCFKPLVCVSWGERCEVGEGRSRGEVASAAVTRPWGQGDETELVRRVGGTAVGKSSEQRK